jgi:hypothetical protein
MPRPKLLRRVGGVSVQWPGVYENWSKAWVRENFWRVEHAFGSRNDALQQCAVVFAKCLKLYSQTVDNEAWFMALFKRAIIHHWLHHAKRATERRPLMLPAGTRSKVASRYNGEPLEPLIEPESGAVVEIWESASPELRVGLKLLAEAGPSAIAVILDGEDDRYHSDVVLNRRWQRFAHIHSDRNIVTELRALLEKNPNGQRHLPDADTTRQTRRHKRRRREPVL